MKFYIHSEKGVEIKEQEIKRNGNFVAIMEYQYENETTVTTTKFEKTETEKRNFKDFQI